MADTDHINQSCKELYYSIKRTFRKKIQQVKKRKAVGAWIALKNLVGVQGIK
jgi:hypothetical protein